MGRSAKAERNAEIAHRWLAGDRRKAIAADFGITGHRVYQITRAAGLPPRPRGGPPISLPMEELLRLYAAGASADAIGDHLGVHAATVRKRLHALGASRSASETLRLANAVRRAALKPPTGDPIELVRLGWTYGDAATVLGITRNAVAGAVHRAKRRAEAST